MRMLPPYEIIRGNSDEREHVFMTTNGEGVLVPYNLSAEFTDVQMQVRDKPFNKGNLIATLSLGDGLTITGEEVGDNNILTVSLSSEQSLNFAKDKNKPYYYDIVFIGASNKVKTLLRGTYEVTANVTTIDEPSS